MQTEYRQNLSWLRSKYNPVLPPGPESPFGYGICMNPFVVRKEDTYYLFYAGDDATGRRQIRLATAPVSDPERLTAHGAIVTNGPEGSFDAAWCVIPNVIEIEPGLWYLYYTGNCGRGQGLSAFPGIGLAISRDLVHWEKYEASPVIPTSDFGSVGIAGGSLLRCPLPDGSTELRFYYTFCPTLGTEIFLDQQKCIAYAVSKDGIHWESRGIIFRREAAYDYENIAVAGPVVQYEDGRYQMWYSAIGSRWGYYSICYAESEDGIHWFRGQYGEGLQHTPTRRNLEVDMVTRPFWDNQMVEYPTVIREGDHMRLYYTGREYGVGGIGTAVSAPIRAAVQLSPTPALKLWKLSRVGPQLFYPVSEMKCGGRALHMLQDRLWTGELDGNLWLEAEFAKAGEDTCALRYRLVLFHRAEGIRLHFALINESAGTLPDCGIEIKNDSDIKLTWEAASPLDPVSIGSWEDKTFYGWLKI